MDRHGEQFMNSILKMFIFLCIYRTVHCIALTQHVHKEQLGHIPMTILLLLLPNRRTNHGTFLGNHGAFFGGGFARADLPDEVAEFEGHDDNLICSS